MLIVFDSLRQLKKHIYGERRVDDFMKILEVVRDSEWINLTIKTINSEYVRNLEDLRYWVDYYQGEATVNGVQMFSRCQDLINRYNVEFLFEFVPPVKLSAEERFERLKAEIEADREKQRIREEERRKRAERSKKAREKKNGESDGDRRSNS